MGFASLIVDSKANPVGKDGMSSYRSIWTWKCGDWQQSYSVVEMARNDFANSNGSWHDRSRSKAPSASISGLVRRWAINSCNRLSSVRSASFILRTDVRREAPGSVSYLHKTLFLEQPLHWGLRPSHCSLLSR